MCFVCIRINAEVEKPMGFLHHNQLIDVTITFLNYDIKNLIMMQKALGLLAHFSWTCGQGRIID